MHLTRLKINALPGIEPGFEFKPAAKGVNLVTGPNASGKSSLVRALAYLLQRRKTDPLALSLEAHFDRNGTGWQVRRNGGQVVWTQNGETADQPALPAADQLGMYHLAMEHLLAENQDDKSLAEALQIQLSGGVALGAPLMKLPPRFASREAKDLSQAQAKRRAVEQDYNDLRQQEAGLPALDAEIAAAENAQRRCERLKQAVDLHHAICDRKVKVEELGLFPPGMGQLLGNEVERLEELEKRLQDLRAELQKYEDKLATHQDELGRTGLEESRPQPEETAANEARLQRTREKSIERENAEKQLEEAGATVRAEIAQFNDHELAPSLNAESIRRSEDIAGPLLLAQAKKRELEQQLALAGDPPEQPEIDQHRKGVDALRKWLATTTDASDEPQKKSAWRIALLLGIVFGAAAFTGLAAYLQNALAAVAGAVVVIAAVLRALLDGWRSKGSSPSEQARRSFAETDLEPPSEWVHATVREHLREIEGRLNGLLVQQERAANTDAIKKQIRDAEQDLAQLDKQKETFVQEVGFEPELPVTAFDRFVRLSVQWDLARQNYAQHKADIERLDHKIMESAKQVGEFIVQWRGEEAFEYSSPDGRIDAHALTSAFDTLKERVEAANQAQRNIETVQGSINATRKQIASAKDDINKLFRDAGLAPDGPPMPTIASSDSDELAPAKRELVRRIEKLDEWRAAKEQFTAAQTEEKRVRRLLKDHPDLDKSINSKARKKLQAEREYLAQCLRWVRTGAIHQLEHEREESAAQADALENLWEQRTTIRTTLNNAGQDLELENALAEEMQAQATLEDKRDHAFLSEATTLLLDDVKQAFQAEHEPEVLRRARELFREVTSHAFDFELGDDGQFLARDLQQEAPRTLAELSSGTRMQLLLALRLAWIQTQERGASPLPLFLDEALTTSDEERFKVMAQSLERLSEAEGRQIFYLSARRHESALWRQATGNTPAVADLATIRFDAERSDPDDYAVETAPPVPTSGGHTPEEYADLLGVPQYDPHTAVGGIHLFHLLRDDLNLLHRLMDTWRIKSLGQLEYFLKSSAAQGAIGDVDHRQTLRNRCTAARHWVELWRQGRGKRVGRPALELSDAVTPVFIDRATELAAECRGDGRALVDALRNGRLSGFWTNKINELEQWFDENGYIHNQPPLSADDRRRLALQQTKPGSNAQAEDINQLIDWLEAAAGSAA